jgi:hypothetical protein
MAPLYAALPEAARGYVELVYTMGGAPELRVIAARSARSTNQIYIVVVNKVDWLTRRLRVSPAGARPVCLVLRVGHPVIARSLRTVVTKLKIPTILGCFTPARNCRSAMATAAAASSLALCIEECPEGHRVTVAVVAVCRAAIACPVAAVLGWLAAADPPRDRRAGWIAWSTLYGQVNVKCAGRLPRRRLLHFGLETAGQKPVTSPQELRINYEQNHTAKSVAKLGSESVRFILDIR